MDMVQIVENLESLGLIRTNNKITGDWYQIYCPFHKDGKERKPSCGVLIRDSYRNGRHTPAGFFNCFTCGHKKPLVESVQEILKMKGIGGSGLEWLNENIPGFEYDESDIDSLMPPGMMENLVNKYALEYIDRKVNGNKPILVTDDELARYRFTVPYMYERGLTDEIIERFDIGFDRDHIPENRKKPVPCITFPVRDENGNCLFIFRRSVEGRYFNYPTGSEKPVYGLYELKPGTSTVVICESAFNMMTCIRHGYEAVALFGTGNSKQIEQLKRLGARRFIIGMDPDEAGERAYMKLKKNLRSVALISKFDGIPSGKDINDLTDEEFENLRIV